MAKHLLTRGLKTSGSACILRSCRDVSTQGVGKHRDDIVSKLERARGEANRRKAECERNQAEVQRLRDVLRRLASELEARAQRFLRADLEELKSLVNTGLAEGGSSPGGTDSASIACARATAGAASAATASTALNGAAGATAPRTPYATDSGVPGLGSPRRSPTKAEPLPSAGYAAADSGQASAGTMVRLRARIEQLERAHAKIRKENEQLRAERLLRNEEAAGERPEPEPGVMQLQYGVARSAPSRSARSPLSTTRSVRRSAYSSPRGSTADGVLDGAFRDGSAATVPAAEQPPPHQQPVPPHQQPVPMLRRSDEAMVQDADWRLGAQAAARELASFAPTLSASSLRAGKNGSSPRLLPPPPQPAQAPAAQQQQPRAAAPEADAVTPTSASPYSTPAWAAPR